MYIKGDAVRLDICWAAPNILGFFFHPIKFPPLFRINFITLTVHMYMSQKLRNADIMSAMVHYYMNSTS